MLLYLFAELVSVQDRSLNIYPLRSIVVEQGGKLKWPESKAQKEKQRRKKGTNQRRRSCFHCTGLTKAMMALAESCQ